MAPSTFASAAAGNSSSQNPSRDPPSEWPRRTNGATQTFRRTPSGIPNPPTTAQQSEPLASQPPRYVPPHRNGTLPDTRYAKDQLLDLFKAQQSQEGGLSDGLSNLFVGGWQPDNSNGSAQAWGRSDQAREQQPGTEVCWEKDGSVEPLGLTEMDDEERELFTNSVNTPIKPPTGNKEGQQSNGLPGRKLSISGVNAPGGFGLPSPNVARGGGRRRETSESFPFPQNNVASPGTFNRDEQRAASPPPSLQRRRTDLKDISRLDEKEGEDKTTSTPYNTLKRNPTGPLSAGFNAPSSPWSTGPQTAGMSPMGSFGNFGIGANAAQPGATPDKRPGAAGGRSESRFKNLMSKDSGEDLGQRTLERKTSISGLGRVNENESWRAQDRPDTTNDTLDESEENLPTGSAALNADTDITPPQPRQGFRGFGTPSRQGTQDEFGFGAFGMTTDNTHGFGQGFLPGREGFHQTPAHQRMGQPIGTGNEPMSPTDTNPYQSPEQHGADRMAEDSGEDLNEAHNAHLPGLGQFGEQQLGGLGGLGALPNLGRGAGAQGPASDRSQTSSVGPNRAFPGLGGLGQLGNVSGSAAWPVSQGGLGTPGRQTAGLSNAFGGGVFSNMSDLQSPSLAGLGGLGPNGAFGGSRMANAFPQGMQDQMRQGDNERDTGNERAAHPFGGFGDAGRAAESPFAGLEQAQSGDVQQAQFGVPGQQPQQSESQGQFPASAASNQPPAPQQRTMVMPDRMRWIYKDPQGQTQGPWTGLEMHDWYKAGFFSPELLVKKYEDIEYEPLAQLIRRIGNSREPFLVPQIGIPHGVPTAPTGPNAWAGTTAINSSGGAQPPFASSFPSFGTTLTAEQQNALERRKQEEQYLMARQKEHLAQAQIAQRLQMQPGHPGLAPGQQLHHHSSAQSLHSQPSFGSITSPTAFQPSPIQGPTPASHTQGFFDNSFRAPQPGGLGAVGGNLESLGRIREEEIPGIMDRLNLGENRAGAGQFGAPGQPIGSQQSQQSQQGGQPGSESHEKQIQQMLQDRARLQQEQADHDAQQLSNEQQQTQASNDRLQQFQQLQNEIPGLSRFQSALAPAPGPSVQANQQVAQATRDNSAMQSSVGSPNVAADEQRRQVQQPQEPLSLTEQVQKAASAQQSPIPQQPGLPQPFPPAPSQSPLPAPAAQRKGRQSVADQLQTESRDLSQTPSVDTPSATVAPWAKEPAEAPKGPSLREIQELEARKAAEAEAIAVAAKRAQLQKELEAQQAQPTAPAPGLPTSSTWGAASPATPTGSSASVWPKTAQKTAGPAASKTLAQIQKEEEARKRRSAAQAAAQSQAQAMSAVPAPAGGKSYANLAGKVTSPAPAGSVGNSAWTTVGAGGKPKTPAGVPSAPGSRTVSAGIVPTVQTSVPARKAPTRSSTMTSPGAVNAQAQAQEEFKRWAIGELKPDLKKEVIADEVFAMLLVLGPDANLITETVHGVSSTIDSRHFANEFLRRKKLADTGKVDVTVPKSVSPNSAANGQSGWNEVAKKGPSKEATPKEEANGNFRMVAAKKKGQSKR